ncbi:MAG: guanylate kinase [Lachnospiraceae bacterium]|nr:guanylate kinase [Lachnospiraceae bacterium]
MGRIFYVMGKSASGKDTIYQRLLKEYDFRTVVLYTTRPMREGETDGREYHFVTEEALKRFEAEGKIIEVRAYHTVHGIWYYFTVDDGQVNLQENNYLMIGTLESYQKLREYYGAESFVPLYIEVDDGVRLERALHREMQQNEPKYAELCRRYLADEKDFAEENLRACGIEKRYQNADLEQCLAQIREDIACAGM